MDHMDNNNHHNNNGHHNEQRTKTPPINSSSSHHHNNDTLLASKIDVLLHQQHGSSNKTKKKNQSSNNKSNSNSSIRQVYANECQVIALILLSRIQDFNIYLQSWQRHLHLATRFLPSLVSLQQQQQQATVDDNDNNDHDYDYYYSLSLQQQPHWIRLISHLLSRFDQAAVAVAAVDDNDTTINVLPPSIVAVVDALTEILLTLLLLKKDEKIPSCESKSSSLLLPLQTHQHLLQRAHVEAIMSISRALDIAFSPASSSSSTTLMSVDRILSCIWVYYHDMVCHDTTANIMMTVTEQPLPFGATTTPTDHDDDDSKNEIKTIPNKEENFDIMLQTLTALWNKDDDDRDDDAPAETLSAQEKHDAAAAARLLDACWHILSLYGARMANSSSSSTSSSPTCTSANNTTLPCFWKLALEWWCSNKKSQKRPTDSDSYNHNDNNTNKVIVVDGAGHQGRHYLAWAEFLLQIIQQPGTHDKLQELLLLPVVAADSLKRVGDDDDNVVDSSSLSCNRSTAQNVFQLLLACIVSPEQQAALPLAAAAAADDDDHQNNTDKQQPQQQPNNRVLRPLAWTCLTNLLQSEKIGWDWLLLMETTTKSSSSSSSNQGRHLTTLVRLAVGEWKIQLGYYLVAGDDSEHGKASCKQQEKEEDCETLILVCGQFIVQTVQFVAQLAEGHGNDDSKRRAALPLLSATNITHLRRSLDEALDAAVQYLGLHPEQHGRVPQVDACVIRVLGSLLTEMNVFDQQQRRPQKQSRQQLPHQQDQDDNDESDNATLHALRIALELTTKSNKNTSKDSSGGGGEGVWLQEHEGYHALLPSLAYVLASAEGNEHCVQLLKDYNVLDRDILPPFLHSFWNQQRHENLETFASVVPWCCQVIELYVGLVTVVETEMLQADLIAWIRRVLPQLPLSLSSPASCEQQQVFVTSLESVVSCYVTLQGETQPPEPDFSIIQQALETCARCLPSEKEKCVHAVS